MNNVNIMGRIATDLTLRSVRSVAGVVTNFKVAVDRYAGGNKFTDFIRCTAWGKTAERICNYLSNGNMIAISGSLTTGDYVDRKGIRRNTTDVLVREFYFTGDGKMKFSGRLNGSNATLTVVGDTNAAFVRRIIDNIQNMDLVNELREKGYERTADTNGFVNIRNMQTGETAGFESLKEARNMFLDPDNEFFHPTEMRIEENTFFRIVSDEPNMDYYISEYDPETGEEVAVYLDDEGKCSTFENVGDVINYADSHNIDYTNTNEQLDHWKFNDEERAADRKMYERNIMVQTRFPHEDNLYPNDILYNPDSKAFSWVYFNEEGDGGDGEFIDITITEDDVLAAYNADNFLGYIYQNCKQNVIDTHSGYFEDYAAAYINPNNDVVRRYQELTIQAYLEEHTPAVQKAKKSLEGEISSDSDALIIDGYEGTWYVVDTETVDGKEIFLLENEDYGDETFGIIIDKDRNVLVDEAWNGFSDYHEKYDNITPEEKLANKVEAEWKAFLDDMKKESPAVLIESAYEISTKDNIQTYITEENLDLSEKQINALLSSPNTLNDLYNDWSSDEYLNSYSDVAELLKLTADKINEAIDRENIALFRKENLACAHDIDAFLSKHYNDNALDSNAALTELLARYSLERIQVVVAANLYKKDFDGRISKENYNWGNEVIGKLSDNMRMGINANYLTTHPGLLNLFANTVREYEEMSLEKAQAAPERTAEDIAVGDRYRYKGADVEVVSMNGIYPNDVGISKNERMGNSEYAVTSNVDKYELHRNGQYLGNGEKTVVSELDMAKRYIEDYLDSEFSSEADFSDMKHISIGYTEIGSEEQGDHSLQMEADLENLSVSYFIDDELAKTEHYNSLEQMNREHLSVLNFEDMLNVGTTELDRILEEKTSVKAVLAVSQYDTDRYYIANDITEEAVRNAIANSDKLFMDLCALGGTQITEVEFAQYSQTEGIAAIDVNINEQTMHIYGADEPIVYFKEIKGIDEISDALDLENNVVGSISDPTPEQREEITRKNNTLNSFFNNNPLAVFREIVKSAGLEPTEDISIGDTKEIFNSLKSVDISLMGYTYALEFEPHDDRLSVSDRESGRTGDFLWGHAKELMYLIANENNISRENLIYNEVMRGTGFVDGKFRVEDFYKTNPEKKNFVDFLKKEYGIGGHSGDGPVKFSDHDSNGIEITLTTGKENFTWAEVAKTISDLIEKGEYITQKDIDDRIRRAQIIIDNANENTDFTSLVHAHEILQKYGIEKSPQDNEYKIYQLKNSPENHAIRFEGYSLAEKHGEPAKPENYDLVYSGSLDEFEDENKLEAIYTKFNLDRPEDFNGHSLSVSDIIVMNNEANYVDSYGFVDVSDKFLGREIEQINLNDYEKISLVRRTEWNDRDLSDAENPAFEEITASYSPDEDGSFTKYETNKTNSINVDVWEDENSVSVENMLADIEAHLRNMRSGVSSAEYHIELTDHDGNIRKLDNNYFDFVMSDSPLIEKTIDFPEIPINELNRTNYSYDPAIGDILEKGDELYRIADISDNMITLEETSSLFHTMESITLSEFTERGYSLVEAAERSEKVKSPLDTRNNSHADDFKSPVDTRNNNFVITDENLGVNGPKARFNANVAAVETLKNMESKGRTATPEEQKILSGYTGWGAIPQAFDPNNSDWKNEYEKLKTVLDDAEYSDARRSTLNAHYTSPVVINAIYEGLANLGFEKGKVLEPAMGIGNFFGVMPENMRGSELHGVELDDLTGRIAKQLYPNADIQIKGFEKTAFANNSFDVVIGNVPFGNYKVNDKDYNKNNFLIHDYFIAKSLDKVHPGGVVAVITSKGTMDKENDDIRKYIAQRAELLGAIRLPDTAFKANAGTEVVSDILFLQKRERPIEIDPDKEGWVKLGVSADGFDVNNYFAEHPEMVIGDFKEVSGRFGNEVTVKLDDPSMLKNLLFEAVQNIKGEYKAAVKSKVNEVSSDVIPAPAESRKFSFQAVNGELYYREAGDTMEKVPVKGKGKDKIARAVAMVELRDTVRELLDLQMNNSDSSLDESISESRAKLNKVYDAFVAKYGFVSDKKNRDAFKGDDDYQLLSALENEDKEHNTYTKADIFVHNTVKPKTIAEHVETAQEALIISVSEKAKVDFEFMSELCGMDKDSVIADLKGQIFRLPQAEKKYVTSDEYLTGNIRKKIAELNNAPEDMDVSENRAALENAIPPRVEAKDISVKLGSHWIAPEYIRQFICEKFNPDWNAKRDMTVQYSKAAGEWKIEDVNAASKKNYTATNVFGTHRMHAYKILEGILNNSDLQVKDRKKDENGYEMRDDKGNYILVVNQEETKAVRQVANLIKSEFQDWIFKDPDRRERLVQTYNEMYNFIRPREYDGSHLNFVGMNTDIILKEHQKNAVARALYGGNTLLAHAVGAGKSYEMIAIAMEGKRLGLHTKSLFAVPNSLTEQMGNDFRKLYPNANVLVATKKDFEKANRLKLFAKIAANDWDAVIVGHTQFDRMGLSPEREKMYLEAELTKLREEMESAAAYGEKSFSVKKIENAIANYQDKLNKLNDAQVKDDFIDFEKLGFDKLFIDECHMYKNLATATKMHNVSGLGSGGSARSFNLLMKTKYMDELTGGKGMTFASGTPISNSMCELYTMMRYLQAGMLKDCGINHFDEWAADFGEVKTDYELKPESDGKYQLKTRFAKFTNLPELMGMFKECADIRTADTLDLEKPEAHFHEVVAEPSKAQKRLIKSLSKRATAIRDGKVDPRDDNMLVITNDGRKIGLDQRLIDPTIPDNPDSKVNLCINNVYDIYSRTADKRSTQCIFCDMSTPKSDARQDRFEVYRHDAKSESGYSISRKKIGLGNGDEDNPKNINTFADVKSYIDKHSPEQSDKLSEGDIVVIRKPNMDDGKIYSQAAIFEDGKLNDVNSVELLEKLLMSDVEDIPPKEFNVYDDIKGKLMDRGVPENEIAFIHDYETAEQKQKLFDKMNAGEVRILLGSTQKCGAGMNAQTKMIALHHLDCPLRPSEDDHSKRNIFT